MRKVIVAQNSGTCFGVDNAIKIAFEAARRISGGDVFIIGELVHNQDVVAELASLGVKTISDVTELGEGDNLIIRAHGEQNSVYDYCRQNKVNVIDCTCPFVKHSHELAMELVKEGYKVIIIGDSDHPEVRGIATRIDDPIIIKRSEDLDHDEIVKYKKVGVISQTTEKKSNFIDIISSLIHHPYEVKIHNTICNATTKRQDAAIKLCPQVDAMVVIGGKNSHNTKHLYELCSERVPSFMVSGSGELDLKELKRFGTIGITAGASTPLKAIDSVVAVIKAI